MAGHSGNDRLYQIIRALHKRLSRELPGEKVHLIETHISWLLLTDAFVYKFKKPLDLGFLDFTTLDKRKFFCREELRLNRRLAPDIYLDVIAVTGTPDRPVPGGDGDVLEYAVKMLRFPAGSELDKVLERGELMPAHIDELAQRVADFHASAASAPKAGNLGTLDAIRLDALDNFPVIGETLQDDGDREKLAELERWTVRQLEQQAGFIKGRKRAGYVRECHGDLHLGNIALYEGRPLPFDCIEFSEDFRFIDIANEIAFLIMDLDARGQSKLAFRFLDAWLSSTGDYEGLRLLRFYCVYRALVRCKICCIRISQDNLTPRERHRKAVLSRHYIDLALQYTRPPGMALLITHGLSGSGKTTATQALLEKLGAIRIRSDLERKRLHGLCADERSGSATGSGIYDPGSTAKTYDRLQTLASDVLLAGFPVIVDATFLKRELRTSFRQLAEERNVPFAILDFQADEEVLRQRVRERENSGMDASEAGATVLEYQLGQREPLDKEERRQAVTIDTSSNRDEAQLDEIVQELNRTTGLSTRHVGSAINVDDYGGGSGRPDGRKGR